MSYASHNVWDPVGDPVNIQTYIFEQKDLITKAQNYRNKPYKFKTYFILYSLFPIIALILFGLPLFDISFDIAIFLYSLFPPIVYYYYVLHLQEEIFLFLLSEKYKWPYNPHTDQDRPLRFATLIPQIFDFGIPGSRFFYQQVWGTITYKNTITSFWRGQFQYTTERDHTEDVLIFNLPYPLKVSLTLVRTGGLKELKEHIETESEDFNNTFQIVGDNINGNTKRQIFNILSPSVQVRLIDFSKKYKTNKIAFHRDMMIIVLDKKIWKAKHMNFFKKVSVAEEENLFNASLRDMVQLPSEMIQFI